MPSIGPLEILLVAVVALIVFGPEKLPDIARTVGKAASQLRRMATDMKDEFDMGIDLDDDEDQVRPSARRSSRYADQDDDEPSDPDELDDDRAAGTGSYAARDPYGDDDGAVEPDDTMAARDPDAVRRPESSQEVPPAPSRGAGPGGAEPPEPRDSDDRS
ncbi:hypothetical protein BH24ACT26_BH24ACT26_09310 [soil metagenome]